MDINDSGTMATTTTATYKKTITTKSTTTTKITETIKNESVLVEGGNDSKYRNSAISTTGTVKRAPPLKNTINNTSSAASGELGSSFKGASTLCTPSTPRIELSRASSSSHHEEDSRDSSPENVFEQVIYVNIFRDRRIVVMKRVKCDFL